MAAAAVAARDLKRTYLDQLLKPSYEHMLAEKHDERIFTGIYR